jgi:4'-phosphopantetheinyl transferase
VFSAAERVALLAMHERDRSRAFMTGWTRKEAYLKARGSGLSADPRLVEVGLGFERSRLVARDEPATEYQIESFVPHPGYVGALAAPSERAGAPGPVLLLRPWPPAS